MTDPVAIAAVFAEARAAARPLSVFPGTLPATLGDAYAIQSAGIAAWPDTIAGWKVGRILGDMATRLGCNRFIGPIFARTVVEAQGEHVPFPVFAGGFGAFEVEILARIGNGPADALVSPDRIGEAISALHVGIEIAGSPLAPINDLGALASIAGFGNNNGLVVGPQMATSLAGVDGSLAAEARIDGVRVGAGDPSRLPGGIRAAVAFACDTARRCGFPLRPGQWIATGALTGVHVVVPGQDCVADFGNGMHIRCRTAPALSSKPWPEG